jgi:ATP-GRASP peptide maturase of grasp-with-spasm system
MILILTCDGEVTSDLVVNSLCYLNYPFFRINSYDLLDSGFDISLTGSDKYLTVRGNTIDLNSVGAVWYRKFGFFKKSNLYKKIRTTFGVDIADNLSKEFSSILGSVTGILKDKTWLTSPDAIALNKFQVLIEAQEAGLLIPQSSVCTSRKKLNDILTNGSVITKSIRDPWLINYQEDIYTMFTSVIEEEDLSNISDSFFPSLTQEKIDKLYEIRVFYLLGEFYAMAIFSQSDDQTKVDFRRYNWDMPNRTIPYKLPKKIETNLLKLVKKLELNCCSIDLIRAENGEYYFLEINPTGQFGMVDFPCNYNLHHKVAQSLIKLDKTVNYEKQSLQ